MPKIDGVTIGVLMPKIANYERFSIRYAGLEEQLKDLGAVALFAFSHNSYDSHTHTLSNLLSTKLSLITKMARPKIVRDLTMPKEDNKPIYMDPLAPRIVHDPATNAFLRDKRNLVNLLPELHPQTFVSHKNEVREAAAAICGELVVVKPVIGQRSQGIFIGRKKDIPNNLTGEEYLIQEFIDTANGIEELGIKSVHNVRVLSVDSEVIGAVGRINDAGGNYLHGDQNDAYGTVYLPEDLPSSMLQIVELVQQKLKNFPGDGHNVIAIDLMRGFNSQKEEVDVLCDVNRRPLRISRDDLLKPQRDPQGLEWLATQWDSTEAQLLKIVSEQVSRS